MSRFKVSSHLTLIATTETHLKKFCQFPPESQEQVAIGGHRKQYAEVLTSLETITSKTAKKEEKIKKLKQKGKKAIRSKNKVQKEVDINKKELVHSDSKIEVNTKRISDSEIEYDVSNFCGSCNRYFMDKKGPKCDWIQCVSCLD
nr:unnamed protein product [Callosobruchus analis]